MKHLIVSILIFGGTVSALAAAPQVTVAPHESDEILANPDMGWETFEFSSRQDKSLPAWIPSTVRYERWGWGKLEPQPGQLDTEFLDKVLKETHDAGQTMAFRVMCCSTGYHCPGCGNGRTLPRGAKIEPSPATAPSDGATPRNYPYHPKWLTQVGGKELLVDFRGRSPYAIPDMDDPVVIQRHLDFIKRLGARYDGHRDIAHVDLGSIGWWGEWHMTASTQGKMPRPENCLKIVDGYLAAFKKTPLLMGIDGGEAAKYACAHGTGWRADCLGDMRGLAGGAWCHMWNLYPVQIRDEGIQDVWKNAPVAWEICWDLQHCVDQRWPLRYIFNYALACHPSVLNNKSSPLPQDAIVRPEIERFLRRLGYRLVLHELTHPAEVRPGEDVLLSMKWQNLGSARCYKPYRLAVRLSPGAAPGKVFVSTITADRWLPGSIDLFTKDFLRQPNDLPPGPVVAVSDRITLPKDFSAGPRVLSVALVDPATELPVVQLGIQGRASDGWYPVSKIQVVP